MRNSENCKVAILGEAYLVRSALQLIVSGLGLPTVVAEDSDDLPDDVNIVLISVTSSQDIEAEINACLVHLDSPRIVLLPQEADIINNMPNLPPEVAAVVPPGMGSEEIESVVLLVADGHRIVPFDMSENHALRRNITRPNIAHGLLTKRQLEILKEVAKGRANKEIARCLNISTNTVEAHVSSIIRKLNVDNRTQAALAARLTLICDQQHEAAK